MLLNSESFRTTNTRFIIRAGFGQINETACAWEARFKYRPHFVRNEIRIQVNRQWRFSGRSFDQVWANTGHLVGASVLSALSQRKTNIKVAQLCADRIIKLLSSAERLPDSYNRLLMRASAEYCLRVVRMLREELPQHQRLLTEIRRFTLQEQDLLSQYSGNAGDLGLLDLQLFDDKFMWIQEEAERQGIFPRLNNIPIDQLVDR